MENSMLTFVLLCVVWLHVEAINVDIPQSMYEVARDRNTTIPCTFKTTVQPPKSGVVIWSRRPTDSTDPNVPFVTILTFYYPDNSYDLSAGFDPNRFSLEADFLKGKADLLINFLKLEDSTTYECTAQIQRDTAGKNVDTTNLVVLAAPSTPICEVQGIPQFGQNIHLICFSEEAFPAPQYKWQSHDVQNNLRPLDPSSVADGGVLSLFGITTDTSGTYTCTSSNRVGSASCSLTLSVTP